MKTEEARVTIYLDIETGSGEMPSIDSITGDKRLKDPVKIALDLEEKQDKAWRAQSLDPFKGDVFCVGVALNDAAPFCLVGTDEKETLTQLEEELVKHPFTTVVGHNIIDFDGFWLFIKGLKYRLPTVVDIFSSSTFIKDTMKMMDGPAWKKMVSLDKMAKILGFSGKGDIDGSMVHQMILDGKGDQICQYCISDVKILRDCYKVLSSFGLG